MKSIRVNDVPEHLRRGAWYRSLDVDDDGAFEVPADCFKTDSSVHSTEDLFFLLRSLQFWQVTDLSVQALGFIYTNEDEFDIGTEFPTLSVIRQKLRVVKEASPVVRIPAALKAHFGLDMIQWLIDHTACELSAEACSAAASVDNFEALAFLRERCCPWNANTRREALRSGSIACWKYAHAHDCPVLPSGERPVNLAAKKGHIDMIKHLRTEGEQCDAKTMICALSSDGIACVEYLHTITGCPWLVGFCDSAVLFGRLDCLRYAHERGCPLNFSVLYYAAMCGNLSCLQYAHEHGCEWVDLITYAAVKSGSLDCLKYAHEHGCPWHDRTAQLALVTGQWRCLYYALCNGAEYCVLAALILPFFLFIVHMLLIHQYLCRLSAGDESARWLPFTFLAVVVLLCGIIPLLL